MGKLLPSLKTSKLPFPLLRPPTSSSTPTPTPTPNPIFKPSKPTRPKKPRKPTATTIPTIFTSPSLPAAKQAYDALLASTRAPVSLAAHNALLRSYASLSPDPLHPTSLLRHMLLRSPSLAPDHSTFHLLFTPSLPPAAVPHVASFMADSGCAPNSATLDVAVRALCAGGHVREALQFVMYFTKMHAPADEFTYNFLVRRLCRATSSMSDVYGAVDELRSSAGLKPNSVTYTILIDEVCGRRKNLREAMRLIKELDVAGFKADCYLYNTIMKAYCAMGECSQTVGVYKKMVEEGVEPDVVTFNTLVFGMSKVGRVEEARKYMDVMVEMGHFPDAVTYTSLMNGMCRKGQATGALELLKEMEERGCEPNECTYNTLLYGLCKGKLLGRAMELYGGMKVDGMKLDGPSYSTLVRVLCRDGQIAEAYGVFDYARESKSLTDVAAYEQLESCLNWVQRMKV